MLAHGGCNAGRHHGGLLCMGNDFGTVAGESGVGHGSGFQHVYPSCAYNVSLWSLRDPDVDFMCRVSLKS
jgi:hypothetical protein